VQDETRRDAGVGVRRRARVRARARTRACACLRWTTTKLARQTRPPAETVEPRGGEERREESQETEYGDWKDCIPSTSCAAQHHHYHTAPQQHHMDQLGPYGGHGSARWHIGEESLRIPGPTRAAFSAQEEGDWTTGCWRHLQAWSRWAWATA
jgi:hypothetical protein